jgi:hypothetical protein
MAECPIKQSATFRSNEDRPAKTRETSARRSVRMFGAASPRRFSIDSSRNWPDLSERIARTSDVILLATTRSENVRQLPRRGSYAWCFRHSSRRASCSRSRRESVGSPCKVTIVAALTAARRLDAE